MIDIEKKVRELHPDNCKGKSLSLKEILVGEHIRKLDDITGIYAFWLDKNKIDFPKLNLKVSVKGKKRKHGRTVHHIKWDWNHHLDFIPLYIGKSTVIGKRIRQHLDAYSIIDWFKDADKKEGFLLHRRKSTVNQFRAGIEQILRYTDLRPKNMCALKYMEKAILITFFELGTEDTMIPDRFYMEDFAIGYYRPWFNVDSER